MFKKRAEKLGDLTGADCFILALSSMMRKNGQHELVGQTQLILAGIPDLLALEKTARDFGKDHPILDANVHRSPWTLLPAWWSNSLSEKILSPIIWRETGLPNLESRETKEIDSCQNLAEQLLNNPLAFQGGLRNLRLDLFLCKDGASVLLFTWNHLLFDGKGAELLVERFIAAMQGRSRPLLPIKSDNPLSLQAKFRKSKPSVDRFFELVKNRYRSLAGVKPPKGLLRYKILKYDREKTETILRRAESFSGLFSISFFLACAARGHRAAFLARGEDPSHYVSTVPVQLRRKGARQNPFQNQVTVLFFSMKKEDLETLETAVQAAQAQFEEMTRQDLGGSFEMVLGLMRRLPTNLYLKFLGAQFSGEITSFFHSATGSFLGGLEEFGGSRILDAYHVPSVSAPPGSGLFFGEFGGRITATFSWREGSVNEKEADAILHQVNCDLLGSEDL